MLASVSRQSSSQRGLDLDVPVDDKDGRWPGARPMLISNDRMRDHKLGLLEPKLFRRWFGCYIVNYNFTAFVGKESVDRELGFQQLTFLVERYKKTTQKVATRGIFLSVIGILTIDCVLEYLHKTC